MSQANDVYKNAESIEDKAKIESTEAIGDIDELIFPDDEPCYISER